MPQSHNTGCQAFCTWTQSNLPLHSCRQPQKFMKHAQTSSVHTKAEEKSCLLISNPLNKSKEMKYESQKCFMHVPPNSKQDGTILSSWVPIICTADNVVHEVYKKQKEEYQEHDSWICANFISIAISNHK